MNPLVISPEMYYRRCRAVPAARLSTVDLAAHLISLPGEIAGDQQAQAKSGMVNKF